MLLRTTQYIKPKSQKAIFFLGPYGVPIKKLRIPIYQLQRSGYSVIAYEFDRSIWDSGDIDKLFEVVDQTRLHIQKTIEHLKNQSYTDFGFIGNSLGSFVIYNCLGYVPELAWGILNTGGDVTEAVWSFSDIRHKFESNGINRQELEKAWSSLQYPNLGNLKGKKYVLITSKNDKTTSYEGGIKTYEHLKKASPEINLIVHKRLNHGRTVVRNLLRVRKLVRKVN